MTEAVEGEVLKARPKLNMRQEKFCQLYASEAEFFGNGVASYIEAYQPNRARLGWYDAAKASASRLLTNVNVCSRINELLEEGGLNDQHADKQLSFLITQHADFKVKLGAIREFNKLKQRVTDRIEHTVKVEPVAVMPLNDGNKSKAKPNRRNNKGTKS